MLSVSLQRKCNFHRENKLRDAFRTNIRNIIGKNSSMVMLANQDLTPMLTYTDMCNYNDGHNIFTKRIYYIATAMGIIIHCWGR